VARKGANRPIFEGEMPPKKMYPQYWRRYWRHNRNPVKSTEDEEGNSTVAFAAQKSVVSANDFSNNDVTTNIGEESNELPTPLELSKELCKIVDTDRYSRDEFKNDETWTCRCGILWEYASRFFYSCHFRSLLDQSSDYEMLLPLLVIGLEKFSSNHKIQDISITLLVGACRMLNGRKIVERSGVMKPLAVLLASSNISEAEKTRLRAVIHYISAP
jgi:hypothetical protein